MPSNKETEMLTTKQRNFVTLSGITCTATITERIDYDGDIMFAVNITSAQDLSIGYTGHYYSEEAAEFFFNSL